MSITIRFASWNIENYGSSKDTKSPALPKLIAKTMKLYKIDILAILEMQNNSYKSIHNKILVALNNGGYLDNTWKEKFVKVGDEGVSFFWHEADVGSANAFKAKTYRNNPTEAIAEKVLKNRAGNMIYFPKTQTSWSSLPGKQEGRRPAFCAFETNTGGTATTFTFLDLHTPFNTNTLIQAYSAYLYPTSREITQVQKFDSVSAAINAKTQGKTEVENAISSQFTSADAEQKEEVAQAAVSAITDDTFIDRWRDEIVAGIDFKKIAKEAAKVAAASAAQEAKAKDFDKLTSASGTTGDGAVVEAAAAAGAAAATYIFAEASTTSDSANQAANAADNAVRNVNYVPPAKKQKTSTGVSSAAKNAAIDAAKDGVGTRNFSSIAGLDVSSVNASALAGDFNIDYPDPNDYTGIRGASQYITGSDKAYSELLMLAGPKKAAINQQTTQRGGKEYDDFSGARVYRLNSANPQQPPGVPKKVYNVYKELKLPQGYAPYEEWEKALKTEASKQGVPWSDMLKYEKEINDAFDSTENYNKTEYFRASAYDNIFVDTNATITPSTGESIDVLSELGNWPADPSAGNFWVASKGNLNAIASIFLNSNSNPGINATLKTAADAAAFYKSYISDHYPVYVEVTIP